MVRKYKKVLIVDALKVSLKNNTVNTVENIKKNVWRTTGTDIQRLMEVAGAPTIVVFSYK